MESLINLLGIDVRTCEDSRLRQVLIWIAAAFAIVIAAVGFSLFFTLLKHYVFLVSILVSLFSVFLLFHIYRMLIVFATTDRLLNREEHQARAVTPVNQRIIVSRLSNFLSLFIKYFFLSVLSLFFAFFIFFQLHNFFSGELATGILNSHQGVFGIAVNFIHAAKFKFWLVYILCVIFMLLPMLITDIFLNKQLIRQNYRTINLRTLIDDREFGRRETETRVNNRRNVLREDRIRHYSEISDSDRPSVKDLIIDFINRNYTI